MPYWKLYYYFILGTKKRLPLIDSVFESEHYRAIVAKSQEMDGFVHPTAGNGKYN